ncbi:unnamed protein product [Phaedon cochleariae]|uniref:MCM10 OB-fold domain-containing protein n=1 Tax=Phaedon cochleariae TaxID=80249 RepID=A0A9N9SLE3_PHACE|nr:unnamed protein product [Phaedon cochleariae]
MNDNEEEDLLDILLSAASQELNNSKVVRPLTEVDLFGDDQDEPPIIEAPVPRAKNGIIHSGDTDSSDEEGNRNFEEKKYNDCGRDIKHLLSSSADNSLDSEGKIKKRISYWKKPTLMSTKPTIQSNAWDKNSPNIKSSKLPEVKIDVYTDPVFGIRIINPLISSTLLQERMMGREAVSFERVDRFLQMKGKEKDWAIAGVIVNKSAVKTSKKGSQFSIWTLSDLKDSIKTVSLFLFSSAHNQLWKTSVGVVIGVLNPNVLDKRDGSKEEVCIPTLSN